MNVFTAVCTFLAKKFTLTTTILEKVLYTKAVRNRLNDQSLIFERERNSLLADEIGSYGMSVDLLL